MKLDFLKDTAGTLLAVAVIGLVGYATQIATLGKDIEQVADSIGDIKKELAHNYDRDDAARDHADYEREFQIVGERMENVEGRINGRINLLDDRITRLNELNIE